MEGGGHKGNQRDPPNGVPQPPGQSVQQADGKAEEDTASHTEHQTARRVLAEHGGKELVRRHHIAGRRLPHTGQAKEQAHQRRRFRAEQGAGNQDGDIGDGDGDGFHMEVPQEGERHQQFQGNQRLQKIAVYDID